MARDRCLREECWDAEIGIKYQPIDGKRILVWPDSKCLNSLNREDRVKFLKELKTKYGFSLLHTWTDIGSNQEVSEAGWSVNEIVVNATNSTLKDLQFMFDFWSNQYADEQMKKLGLTSSDNIPLWRHFKERSPSFYSIFYDEPLSNPPKDWPIEISYGYTDMYYYLSQYIKGINNNIDDFLSKLCHDTLSVNEDFKRYPILRFVLMSLYIHACLDTKFVVGEHNAIGNNYWRELLNQLDALPKIEYWPNWIDSISYQAYGTEWGWAGKVLGYHDQSSEWQLLDDSGWSGGRAWISLQADHGEFDTLFKNANELNWNEMWLFPQADDNPDWNDCDTYKQYLTEFLDAAARKGFVRRVPITERRCITYRIPGCKDGAILDPNPVFDPFINRNPIFP